SASRMVRLTAPAGRRTEHRPASLTWAVSAMSSPAPNANGSSPAGCRRRPAAMVTATINGTVGSKKRERPVIRPAPSATVKVSAVGALRRHPPSRGKLPLGRAAPAPRGHLPQPLEHDDINARTHLLLVEIELGDHGPFAT